MKKPSKKRAFEIVQTLKDVKGAMIITNEYTKLVEELYQYFIPAPPKTPKTGEQWVSKAVAVKKDIYYNRRYLKYMMVANGLIVGTDGSRMHVAPTDLPDGAYDAALTLIDPEKAGKFPTNWKRLTEITDHSRASLYYLTLEVVEIKGKARYKIIRTITNDYIVTVDKELMDQALCWMKNPHIYYKGPKDSIIIRDSHNLAVLMPITITN